MNSMKSALTRSTITTVAVTAACLFSFENLAQDAGVLAQSSATQFDAMMANTEDSIEEVRALLVPHRQAMISSQVAERIQTIHVRDGDRFSEGDVLVSFTCDVIEASLRSAFAKKKQYQITYDANVELRKDDAASKLDVALSEARLEEAKANLALAQVQQQKCRVMAPYDGRVVKVTVNEHESVEIGTSLIEILDDAQLEMTLHLPSSWVASVSNGTKFKVSIDETGKLYDASVFSISPKIDAASRTVEINARVIGEQDDLLAGMSGNAHFDLRR